MLREIASRKVGGELILQNLINKGAAIPYQIGGIDFVKLRQMEWGNSTTVSVQKGLDGQDALKAGLGGGGPDFFASFLTETVLDFDVMELDKLDAKVLESGAQSLALEKKPNKFNLGDSPPPRAAGGGGGGSSFASGDALLTFRFQNIRFPPPPPQHKKKQVAWYGAYNWHR